MIGTDSPPKLLDLVRAAAILGASDLHVVPGRVPLVRVDGQLRELESSPLVAAEVSAAIAAVMPDAALESNHSIDHGLALDGGLRARIHAYATRCGWSIAARLLPARIPTWEECGLDPEAGALSQVDRGLVLVCGVTGSGKSTTIAALVDAARRARSLHVVTIEDPIEHVYQEGPGVVSQREVGVHSPSFARALRDALRADPDLIVVGELRDAETIELALLAAETGHAVFASVHAGSCAGAVDRIVNALPATRRDNVRMQVSGVLEGVIYQELHLLPRGEGGRTPITEVLRGTLAVRQMIRDGKTHQIRSVIEVSGSDRMLALATSAARRGIVVRG
jgi:twitching motility protein PilT